MGMQTEYAFTLPRGYADSNGNIHKQGTMRLATAMDEIAPLRDLRVKSNQAYLAVVLLAQVITKLGTLNSVDTGVVENLFSADFAYLQDFYRRINEDGTTSIPTTCPECKHEYEVDLGAQGES